MSTITGYRFGHVLVDDRELTRDVIVLPNRVIKNWWRREGHELAWADLQDAAVEVLRHPGLADKPVIVGGDGDPTKRGVVSTANYVARRFGVGSAMPLRTAFKRVPEAVFLPVDAPAYLEASRGVMEVLRSFPAVVQVLGWDEAFMGVTADDPEALAHEVQARVLEE